GGKTTLTMGIMKALCNRQYKVQGYKVGPDYIDPGFHSFICGVDSRNLDTHLMGEEGVKASFSRGKGDIAIVEGVMGFYDGMGLGTQCSTAHLARIIDLPVVLVLSPKAQMATLFAQINGILAYEKNNIVGVILNNISESYYEKLKIGIEEKCRIKVFGYLPKDPKVEIGSRSLGLIQTSEIKDLEEKIEYLAGQIEKYVDMEKLISCMGQGLDFQDPFQLERKGRKIAVARDQAFNFYYKENLELLEQIGEVTYFSPLKDEKLPENLDFLYIGGGYPETFAQELSSNHSLLKDIKEKLNQGLRCYAESGGFLYLTSGTKEYPMVGFFEGEFQVTKRLQNFGYAKLTVSKENPLLPRGLKMNCQQFHRSSVTLKEPRIYCIEKDQYAGSEKSWTCGYQKKNTIGTYAYTHFFGNIEMFRKLLTLDERG
ncbi:MAG TPA: cobyrinate a,c-diamide synthase, partial [Epulopiscium sp.]|nr:cobyrinate a,c-diamide synthase [Candidatus Epulonipiscium sp.]